MLGAVGPSSIYELEYHLGVYSPGRLRLAAILNALVRSGELVTTDRPELVDRVPMRVTVFSIPNQEENQ